MRLRSVEEVSRGRLDVLRRAGGDSIARSLRRADHRPQDRTIQATGVDELVEATLLR
jgi:hypothetical protein